jgi:3-isopropylmalate/(R)-2-methylmalate dehydratase small subunit
MTRRFTRHTGIAAPFLNDNTSTDTIIPSREMKRVSKKGLGEGLFANLRYSDTGRTPDPSFVLNRPEYAGASVLLVGRNFGSGSSREHAVWALDDFGIRVIIGESFGTIFYNNCIANGLLPVQLDSEAISSIAAWCEKDPQASLVSADLEQQTVEAGGRSFPFEIAAAERDMLLGGLSPIDVTLQHRDAIVGFMKHDREARPWLHAARGEGE